MPIADKIRRHPSLICLGRLRNFEIEDADAIPRFALVSSPVTRAHHNSLIRSFFAAEINHGVGDGRVALDVVGPGPKKKIPGDKLVQLEGVLLATVDRLEIPGFTQPDILLARIARHGGNAILCQDVKNETGAIHPAIRGIGRPIFVVEISCR